MGKTCLNAVLSSVSVSCEIPVNGVKEIYVIPTGYISSFVSNGTLLSSISFASDGKAYKIEGYKQNIQVTSAVRTMDASSKLDISVSFKIPHELNGELVYVQMSQALLMGSFYVMSISNSGAATMYGLTSPLECTALDFDSNTNGQFRTVTLSAPDGSGGNYFVEVSQAAKNTIISKSA